jgi:tripartite-type tricarboxylate transporter receptor subunit TctC
MPIKPCLLLALLVIAGPAFGQTTKPLQMIVPFAPGGSADGIGRLIASELATRLGRQAVVENKPGAGGSLGLTLAAKAPPDGSTLAVAATGALVINPHIPGSAPFDPLHDLVPVARLINIPIVLVTSAKSGPKTIKEIVEQSKAAPHGMSYGTTGANSSQHLAVELLKKMTGANLVHVPYRGSLPAVTDVIGGQIPLASVDLTSAHENIKAGNLNAIGVTSAQRAKSAPEIPTIAEGGVAGYDGSQGFIGLFAPAGTPAAVVKQLSQETAAILARPEIQTKVGLLSVEPAYEDDVSFGKFLAAESAKWKDVLQSLRPSN